MSCLHTLPHSFNGFVCYMWKKPNTVVTTASLRQKAKTQQEKEKLIWTNKIYPSENFIYFIVLPFSKEEKIQAHTHTHTPTHRMLFVFSSWLWGNCKQLLLQQLYKSPWRYTPTTLSCEPVKLSLKATTHHHHHLLHQFPFFLAPRMSLLQIVKWLDYEN